MTALMAALLSSLLWLPQQGEEKKSADDKKAEEKQAEEAALAAVKEFKPAYAAATTEAEKSQKVSLLAALHHKKTMVVLGSLLLNEPTLVRVAAADALGTFKDVEGAWRPLVMALQDRQNDKKPTVRKAILKALGELRAKEALPVLHAVSEERDFDVAKEAVLAIGKTRNRQSVPHLIKLLKKAERPPDSTEGIAISLPGLPGLGGNMPGVPNLPGGMPGLTTGNIATQEQTDRNKIMPGPINQALALISGEKYITAKEWEEWWRRHGADKN